MIADPGIASHVILVRPTGFGHDPETAESNSFQKEMDDPEIQSNAATEFDGLLEALRQAGVGFTVLDPMDRSAPNAVFPNNWVAFHQEGLIVTYPMLAPTRRR